MSKIEFLGACQTVTGSKFIISNNTHKILLDCGMFQGYKDESYLKNKEVGDNTPTVDYCLLSHAHIDHSGMLPSLVKGGFKGKIYSTPPTRELCTHMLRDSVAVFTKELSIINKMLKKKKIKTEVSPLYDINDVIECLDQFVPVRYDDTIT